MLEDMRDERLTIIFKRIQARARGKQMRVEFQKMLERKLVKRCCSDLSSIHMGQEQPKEEKQTTAILRYWTFRQHRFSCHHQQCKQGSTKP